MTLHEILSVGAHTISHTKKDGSVAVRSVTLDPTLIVDYEYSGRKIKKAEHLMHVWDVNKGSWVAIFPETVTIHPPQN